jgi:hypothetical protein
MKLFFLLVLFSLTPCFGQKGVSVMVKQHEARSDFSERPYGNDDLSYGVYLDLFEGVGGWRFGAAMSDDLSGVEGVDTVITPEITLLVVDQLWETGISALMDYVDTEGGSEWGDIYFQTQLGINVPVSDRIQMGVHIFYPMESITDIVDFSFSDLDMAVQLRVMF